MSQNLLAQSHLFTRATYDFTLTKDQRQEVTHERAKAIALSFNLTVEDILTCSEKFWNATLHPINVIDGAAAALWTIHVNLACGTLTQYAGSRPEIRELCRQILAFEMTAHYMLTEVGHGLDSQNIETTAELLPDGNFEIHTPNRRAAKFMPASIIAGGVPRIAVLMAQLIVRGQRCGIRPFVVPLNDGKIMHPGVSCRVLPDRSGTRPIGHAITTFTRVKIPATAFIGDLDSTLPPRIQFLASIWRLGVGSATMAALCIPALRVCAHIATQYAKRRTVSDSQGNVVPIITFRTTQVPILRALSEAAVTEALYKEIRPYFSAEDTSDLPNVLAIRNALAGVMKTITVYHFRESSISLTDRLGAQGLFSENQLVALEMEIRGMTIAEGDVTVLCIRLASELLLGRYSLPAPRYPDSLLAQHEKAIFAEMRELLAGMNNKHRSEEFNRLLLPRSKAFIVTIGQRMAYEAAVDARVDPVLVSLYEASAIIQDLSWYVESGKVRRKDALAAEDVALTAAFAKLDEFLEQADCGPCVHAPVISQESWEKYVSNLTLLERPSDRRIAPQPMLESARL
ncbi:acyl-CoA dehydrogenase NM domain-like protein [Mycena albidolilacea]|uniref:Acyl-CoA dehydrogenase NM domain-like protein n=1 Tax=Mycena albidolilacea TaxID=1033008 RepID=A0AAD7A1G6_9AGAR|nr:acyl-CoA dehydrogenase NM domain-like protein [Mycena albidolilacea]